MGRHEKRKKERLRVRRKERENAAPRPRYPQEDNSEAAPTGAVGGVVDTRRAESS
jgi:hypothetical protein